MPPVVIAIAAGVSAIVAGYGAYSSKRAADKAELQGERQEAEQAALLSAQKNEQDKLDRQAGMARQRAILRAQRSGDSAKGGTMLTGPLGVPGNANAGGQKTLLGL